MVKAIRVHRPGEAQIRHHAIGVNFIDVYRRTGAYPAELPFIPGHEGAGEIVAVGEGVKGFKQGNRVAYVAPLLGGYAEARNIDAGALIRLPKSISFEQGAAMMLKGLTAQYLLRRTFKVKRGHRVLVHAGAGGVGQMLCQWASALGAKVIATVGSAEKAGIAQAAGARHTILYRNEDFAARVRDITNGKMCDVVYDGVGKATFPASLDCLKPFGMFVSFGSASGPIDAFDIGLLSTKGSLYATRPSLFTHIARRRDYEAMTGDMLDAFKQGRLKLESPARAALADAARVHEALESRATTGSIVLIP